MKHEIPTHPRTGMRQIPAQKVDVYELALAHYFDGSLWVEHKGRGTRIDKNVLYGILKKHWDNKQ